MNTRSFLNTRPGEQSSPGAGAPQAAPQSRPPAAAQGGSVIGEGLVIVGDVESTGALTVDGAIKGDIDCQKLTVSQGGQVEGDIRAETVIVYGTVTGTIRGRSVMLYATAKVSADIKHQGVGIEMGTRYDGALKWVDDAELQRPKRSLAGSNTPGV